MYLIVLPNDFTDLLTIAASQGWINILILISYQEDLNNNHDNYHLVSSIKLEESVVLC